MKDFIEQYKRDYSIYDIYASRLETLIVDIISAENIKVHFTESRAKSSESLIDKISRPVKFIMTLKIKLQI